MSIPAGAQFLHVAVQGNTPCLWGMVDPESPEAPYHFRLYGTGHFIQSDIPGRRLGRHLGTFLVHGGSLVFHLFEEVILRPAELEREE